jgi:hypothetical protein
MLILAKLVFKSYMPKKLEIGMWFKKHHSDVVYGKIYNYITIYELKELPPDMDEYISINGAPVEPYIIQPMKNPDDPEEILVISDFIGWWEYDDGYDDDDGNWTENIVLDDLSPKFINEWIYGENGDNDGLIALEVNEDREPITYVDENGNDTGKVIIKQSDYVNEGEDDEEDDYEDMDWEDDEPEEDSAGYTINDRNPDSNETT